MFTQPQQRTTLPGITANLGKQKSQSEIYNLLRSVDSIVSDPLLTYEKYLSKQIQVSTKDLTNEVEKQKAVIGKMKNVDATKMSAITNRMNEIKRKNDELLKKVLSLQDVIIEIASHQGKLQLNSTNIQRQNEIYKSSNQVKRLSIEMDKKLYDIDTVEQTYNSNLTDQLPPSIKDMQIGIQQIVADALKDEAQLKGLKRTIFKR